MEIFDSHDDLRASSFRVVRYFMSEQFVHETFEAIVFAVADKSGAMVGVPYVYAVTAGKGDEVSEDVRRAIRHVLWSNRWRSHKGSALQSWESIIFRGYETCKAKGEEIGRVAGAREGVSRDDEGHAADRDVHIRIEKLRCETWQAVELGVRIELDEVGAVLWCDEVA